MKFVFTLLSFLVIEFSQAQKEIFTVVETMPVFTKECSEKITSAEKAKCSNLAVQQYMYKVDYPLNALEKNIQGKVYVSFVLDTVGLVTDVELRRGVNKLIDDAAIRHLKNMPAFYKPGFQNGKAVNVKYTVPLVFKIETPSQEEIEKVRESFFGD